MLLLGVSSRCGVSQPQVPWNPCVLCCCAAPCTQAAAGQEICSSRLSLHVVSWVPGHRCCLLHWGFLAWKLAQIPCRHLRISAVTALLQQRVRLRPVLLGWPSRYRVTTVVPLSTSLLPLARLLGTGKATTALEGEAAGYAPLVCDRPKEPLSQLKPGRRGDFWSTMQWCGCRNGSC
jgi:hypothetical protein